MINREVEVAWAAGIFEGEGCAAICKAGTRRFARLYVNMTDGDVMQKFYRIVGVGSLNPPTAINSARVGLKPTWRWSCGARTDVTMLLDLFEPHMGVRRLEKFAELRTYL